MPRLLYIFQVLDDKQRLAEVVKRIERARLPEIPDLLTQLAEAYDALGNTERQLALLEKRARLSGLAELASLLPEKDKRHYKNILTHARKKPGAREKAAVALAYLQTGKRKKVIEIYAELVVEGNRTPSIMCDYAQALADIDKVGEAITFLNDVIGRYPREMRPYLLLAQILIHEKDYPAAETAARKALNIQPDSFEALRTVAHVQELQKNLVVRQSLAGSGKKKTTYSLLKII